MQLSDMLVPAGTQLSVYNGMFLPGTKLNFHKGDGLPTMGTMSLRWYLIQDSVCSSF